jgi:hypothetical protein
MAKRRLSNNILSALTAGTVCALLTACGINGSPDSADKFARTDRVDVFLSAEEIPRRHRKIGETELTLSADQSLGQTQHRARREARRRGAHAVVIHDKTLSNSWLGSALAAPGTVTAHFYRYGSPKPVAPVIVEPEIPPADTEMPEAPLAQTRATTKEIKPRRRWWWNRDKNDDTLEGNASAREPAPEKKRIDPTGTAVFTGDVEKLEKLGLPKPKQTVMED